MNPVKTAERTEMPFGVWTCDGTGNHALDMNRESPTGNIFDGGKLGRAQTCRGRHIQHTQRDSQEGDSDMVSRFYYCSNLL